MADASTAPETGTSDSAGAWLDTELIRAISPRMLMLFILGDIVGGGIYALVGTVAGKVGGAIWAPFALAFVLALLTAASYAELITKYPRAGGATVYVARAYRSPALAFVTGIAVLASGLTSAAALATAFGGQYFQTLFDAPQLLVSLLFIAVVAFINLRGISESVRVNMVLTLIEVAGLIAIVLIAIKVVASGAGEPARALHFAHGGNVFLLVLSGAALAFYSFVGFEDTANLAEEVEDPVACYPRALFLGLGAAGCLYLAVTAMSSMAVPTGRLAGSDGPLLEVVRIGGGLPIKLFAVVGLLAVSNGALINMVMASRLLYGMSRGDLVPGVFSRVLATRRTPWVAILFTTALAAALIATGSIAALAATTSLLLLCVFILVNGAVLLLRRDADVTHQHFHVPTIVPVAGMVVCAALLTQQPADAFLRAAVLVAAGIALWLLSRAGSRVGGVRAG